MSVLGDNITASYVNEKFEVTWSFGGSSYQVQPYDRIEVKEINEKGDETTFAVQMTKSSQQHDTMNVRPLSDINTTGTRYYAVYMSGASENEVSRSSVFTIDTLASPTFEDDFLVSRDDCAINVIQVHSISVDGRENCEIDIEWKFNVDARGLLSKDDYICVIPSKKAEDLKNIYHEYACGVASGKESGKVSLQLGGFVRTGHEYQVFYLLNNCSKDSLRKGASTPFVVDDSMIPYFDNPAATKADSMQFNYSTVSQYNRQDLMEKLADAADYNPLLTVKPRSNKWVAPIEESREEHKVIEEEVEKHIKFAQGIDVSYDLQDIEDQMDEQLNDSKMIKQVTAALRQSPGFLFVGDDVSIAAPSLSPSWSTLMSFVLEETFKAIPAELKHIVTKLRNSDSTRRPEDVLEVYHLLLQDKVVELLKSLDKGEPNANHKVIAKMAKDGKLKSIMTTNFDEYIERALDEESVPYKLVCTNDEFREYYKNGCEDFAVLKLRGTMSRPETIISVAMHYSKHGGFGGYKSLVAHKFVKSYPTFFLGCSGWDFGYSTYQEFWAAVGKKEGEKIYFLKLKGRTNSPMISNLVGRHIGDRLIIGECVLPHSTISILERFQPDVAADILQLHNDSCASPEGEKMRVELNDYIRFWVHQIPKSSALAILWSEAAQLNESTKLSHEKTKLMKMNKNTTSLMSAATTDGVTTHLVDLAMKFSQGFISNDVYLERQRLATLELSFAPLAMTKANKKKLVELCNAAYKSHHLLNGPTSHDYQFMLPSYVMNIADVSEDDVYPQEMLSEALDYIVEILEPLNKKRDVDETASILYDLYHTQANVLRIREHDRQEIHDLFQKFAEDAAEGEWSEDDIENRVQHSITPIVTRVAFQLVDTDCIVDSLVGHTTYLHENQDDTNDDFIGSAYTLALSLHKQANHRIADLYKVEGMQKLIHMLSIDVNRKIPDSTFEHIEMEMTSPVKPVIDLLNAITKKKRKFGQISVNEVLATFEMAATEMMRQFLTNTGSMVMDERRREGCGHFPRDSLPTSVATFLSRKMIKASSQIKDDRAVQSCLGLLCILGESSRDIKHMKAAVDKSLALTDDRVTEVTPYPIPEALAALYQEKNDVDKSLQYYKLALEGINNFVPREKTDAIILNACLVQAQTDKREALKMAFVYSPYFSDNKNYKVIGPGRAILIQQCESWASEFGLSLDEARFQIMIRGAIDEEDSDDDEDELEEEPVDEGTAVTVEERDDTEEDSKNEEDSKKEKTETKKGRNQKQSKVVQGLSNKQLKARKRAVTGDKSCEKCTIM